MINRVNKITLSIMIVIMTLSVGIVAAQYGTTGSEDLNIKQISCVSGQIIGDLDNDKIIAATDWTLMQNLFGGKVGIPDNICCIDLNQDGEFSAPDWTIMNNIFAGKSKSPGKCPIEPPTQCQILNYSERCYNYGDTFTVNENERFSTKSWLTYVQSIQGTSCTGDICAQVLPKVSLFLNPICEPGKNCVTGGPTIEFNGRETKKIEENIYLRLEGVYVDTSVRGANSLSGSPDPIGTKTATFKIMQIIDEGGIYVGECPVGCICNEGVITCPNENEEPIEVPVEVPEDQATPTKKISISKSGPQNIIHSNGIEARADNVSVVNSILYIGSKEVKIMPDTASEIAIERLGELGFVIELRDTGQYHINAEKEARLFLIIPIKEKVSIDIDSETGEVISVNKPWWGFLAKDIKEGS